MLIYFAEGAPTKDSLGSVNGLAQMIGCTMRSFAPWIATSLFSFSLQLGFQGGTLSYILVFALSALALYSSTYLPRRLASEDSAS